MRWRTCSGPAVAPLALARLWGSSVGLKIIMALTGVILSGFVLVHMLGNLQVFQGRGDRRLCQAAPQGARLALDWPGSCCSAGRPAHLGLLVLTRQNQQARPGLPQGDSQGVELRLALDALTGPLLLAFIIYHILHLTTGTVHPDYHEGAVYHNLVTVCGWYRWRSSTCWRWWCWGSTSGTGSGACSRRWGPSSAYGSLGRRFATVFTLVVVLGFAAVPLAIVTGFVK